MKALRYLFALLLMVAAVSCTEQAVNPTNGTGDDDDDPIVIGQPPHP